MLGSGLDGLYPSENRALAAEIRPRGAIVSEFPLGTPPDALGAMRCDREIRVRNRTARRGRGSARSSNSCRHGCARGHYGDPTRACTRPEAAVSRYRKCLSGPFLGRVPLHVEVPRVDYEKGAGASGGRVAPLSSALRILVRPT